MQKHTKNTITITFITATPQYSYVLHTLEKEDLAEALSSGKKSIKKCYQAVLDIILSLVV